MPLDFFTKIGYNIDYNHALVVKWISRLASDQLLGVRIPPGAYPPIAQPVEQLPLKQTVAGSNPAGRT